MVYNHPSYGPSPPIMTFSENLRSSPSAVSRSLPRIRLYLPLVDLSTWHFQVNILVAINSGKQKSIFTFFEVVKFPAWVYQIFFSVSFDFIFDVSSPTTVDELIPLSNIIRNFLNSALPLRVFIQPCRIGEQWLFLVLACFVGLKKLDSTLHSRLRLLFQYFLLAIWTSLRCTRSHS